MAKYFDKSKLLPMTFSGMITLSFFSMLLTGNLPPLAASSDTSLTDSGNGGASGDIDNKDESDNNKKRKDTGKVNKKPEVENVGYTKIVDQWNHPPIKVDLPDPYPWTKTPPSPKNKKSK